MSFLDGLRHRLHVLRRGESYSRDVERELRFHVELDALSASPGERGSHDGAARRRLGNNTYYREEVRRMTLQTWIDRIRQDAAYAVRGLERSPGFACAVVLTLGLGIGVNGAMFSLLDRIFLQPPAGVARPAELRRLYLDFESGQGSLGRLVSAKMQYPYFRAFRAALDPSVALAIYSATDSTTLRDGNARIPVRRIRVNSDYFTVLGVNAQAGRTFGRDEDDIAVPTPVAVISDALWRRSFHEDRQIVGRRVLLGGRAFTIVGIAPPDFAGLDIDAVDLWVPANTIDGPGGTPGPWYDTFGWSFNVVARPRSPAEAQRVADIATAAIRRVQIPTWIPDPTIRASVGSIVAARGPTTQATEVTVAMRVAGVSLMVLLIAAANVTNLLLLRAASRKREIAVRRALGVTHWRLVEQLTVESVILALLGGGAALLFSLWGAIALRRLVLPNVHWATSPLDPRMAAFILGVSLSLGVIAGLAPAFQAMKPDLAESLKAGTRNGAYRASRLRSALLSLQAALSIVLLVGAGLFIRSLDNVQSIGLGYDPTNVVFIRPSFDDPAAHAAEVQSAIPEAAMRLATVDGVEAVAYASAAALMQGARFRTIYLPDRDSVPQVPGDYGPSLLAISPGFFKASGLRLNHGREFNDRDQAASQPVMIVGESLARAYWPGETAMGKCFMIKRNGPCHVVVGVAADAHRRGIIEGAIGQYYLPITQTAETPRSLVVRTRPGRNADVVRTAEQIFQPLVSEMTGLRASTFASVLEPELRPWRLGATLFSALGVLAVVVAAVGVYAVVAYGVSQRSHEMGVRIALGADRRRIVDLVLGDGLRVVGVGIVVGVGFSLALGRLVASLLFGVLPNDVSVLIAATVILCVVSAMACLVPGLRAASVDPATTLRAE